VKDDLSRNDFPVFILTSHAKGIEVAQSKGDGKLNNWKEGDT
jgi:hypothetical protein